MCTTLFYGGEIREDQNRLVLSFRSQDGFLLDIYLQHNEHSANTPLRARADFDIETTNLPRRSASFLCPG